MHSAMMVFDFLTVILLIIIIVRIIIITQKKRDKQVEKNTVLLSQFGVIFGASVFGLYFLLQSIVPMSTPVWVKTKNLMNESLTIYVLTFYNNERKNIKSRVNYGGKLSPNEEIEFIFENDHSKEFWVVAINREGKINFLMIESGNENHFEYQIKTHQIINQNQRKIIIGLISPFEKKKLFENILLWVNGLFVGLLILDILYSKNSKKRKNNSNDKHIIL